MLESRYMPAQRKKIMQAYRLSKYGHRGQFREGEGRYFEHPKAVAVLLLQLNAQESYIICGGLLHDFLEDSYILEPDDLRDWFGAQTSSLVNGLTKEEGMSTEEYFARLSAQSPDCWLVKLADRLHNLSTLVEGTGSEAEKFRLKKVKQVEETRQYLLPLASALQTTCGYEEKGIWLTAQIDAWCKQRESEAAI
jgi:GTP pyrophosphokinase